ncbi:MarR family transcriptional regulator [Mycobacterium sp. ITM-2016-00316]|uniref:MarR family winged helix-turn-helix transcriptional regulator n=1 Tax=Mycobacterium sp. ITM-2016-00316 TaxID=2099695 RepID=UPI0018EE2D34|nr:MarR family transcriptional regulator [Mycobacterium sp. ITM-2016-00316]WNG82942.1 MarR family transcriptional regulator [Mycobacterium sp. ITM-2016-00316]
MTGSGSFPATTVQLAAWRALYRADALLVAALNEHLRAGVGIVYVEREVLDALHRGGGRLRMGTLAAELMISRSGTTRLVDRMEKCGWVRRESVPEDRRSTWAELTDEGRDVFHRAQPVVDAVVATFFGKHVSTVALKTCALALTTLTDANRGSG